MEYGILIVDDEDFILSALRRVLRGRGYRVLTANGGAAGLEVLSQNEVQVVLSDQRMPNMSGSEFLAKVNERYPNTVRMVLSGYADFAAVTDAINQGHIYKFLVKPWDEELLLAHIDDAFARFQMGERGAQFTKIYENTLEGIIITDGEGRIQAVNPAFTQITGYAQEEVAGRTPSLLGSGRHDAEFFRDMWASLAAHGHWVGELWNRRKDGEEFPELLNISAIRDQQGKVKQYVGLFSDISKQKKSEEVLRHQAYHDPLTDLPNRLLYMEHLDLALNQARRRELMTAVIMLDLDNFKNINDTYGHEFGDKLLMQVSRMLSDTVRKEDTLARMGGDEFTVLLPLIDEAMDARQVGEKILKLFSKPLAIDQTELFVTPSMGIALFPADGKDADTLLKHADAAMYRAKEGGRNNYQFFTPDMNIMAQRRLMIENDLRRAMEAGQLEVYYQPKFDAQEDRVVGAEALTRWKHPEHGWISPGEFIPVAEDGGLILPLGEWLMDQVSRDIHRWRDAGLNPPTIAINISGRQFQHQSLDKLLADVLCRYDLTAAALELEITESTIMANAEKNIEALVMLKRMGFSIAIDDFGTGYSSLSYLRRFPVDVLKVDYSFVRDIATDDDCAELIRGVINMAHGLRLKTVAEGVEHPEQLERLRDFGCDVIQGFLKGRPMPATDFAAVISRTH